MTKRSETFPRARINVLTHHSSIQADSTKKREAYFLDFASQLRPRLKRTKLAVSVGQSGIWTIHYTYDILQGGFRTFEAMNNAIASDHTDCKSTRSYPRQKVITVRHPSHWSCSTPGCWASSCTKHAERRYYQGKGQLGAEQTIYSFCISSAGPNSKAASYLGL